MKKSEEVTFSFETLEVWQKSVGFAKEVIELSENIDTRRHYRLIEQLLAASTSIASNIAEGKGRQYRKEFVQFLHISQGSIYEDVTLNEIFRRGKLFSGAEAGEVRARCVAIDRKLNGLINSLQGKKRYKDLEEKEQ